MQSPSCRSYVALQRAPQCKSVIREQWPFGQWQMLDNLIGKNATTPTPLIYSRARFSQISARRPNVCDCTGLLCHFGRTPPLPFSLQNSSRQVVCGASKSLTRFRGNPNLAERKSNRWPYRSQWLSGDLLAPPWKRISRSDLMPRYRHFLFSNLIAIHHYRCYLDVILPSSPSIISSITLMLFFQSHTLTIWSCWVPTWRRRKRITQGYFRKLDGIKLTWWDDAENDPCRKGVSTKERWI